MTLTLSRAASVRVSALALSALAFGVTATSASADRLSQSASFSTFPADYRWDGGGVQEVTGITGSYSISSYNDTFADSYVPGYVSPPSPCDPDGCNTQLVRGGVEVKRVDEVGNLLPFGLAPGDIARQYNRTSLAPVYDVAYPGAPAVISSVVGSGDVTIARSANSSDVSVALMRRVARSVRRGAFRPGTYTWQTSSSQNSGDPVCTASLGGTGDYDYESPQQKYQQFTDVVPAKPTAELPAGQYYVLRRQTQCGIDYAPVAGAPYEAVAYGRMTAVGADRYTASFGVPMQAGDLISYTQDTEVLTPAVSTTLSVTTVAPVGVVPPVPPADTTAPVVKGNALGAAVTTIKSFTKNGLFTFVTLDEPGTVTQQLTLPAEKSKKKTKKAKKKATTPAAPIVIGTGTATTTAAGATAKVGIFVTKDGRTALKKVAEGKSVTATLITTVKDAAGNTVTAQTPLKLSAK